jgi:hypothetical protein
MITNKTKIVKNERINKWLINFYKTLKIMVI